jgi:hypothetical protein
MNVSPYKDIITEELIRRFLWGYYPNGTGSTVYIPSLPPEMIISEPGKSGWVDWKLVKSPVTDRGLDAFEQMHNLELAPDFRIWLKSYCFLDGCFSLASFEEMPYNDPLGPLVKYWEYPFHAGMRKLGLVPFAMAGDNYMHWAFHPGENHAIYEFDTERGADSMEDGAMIFTSFRKLLEFFVHFVECPEDIPMAEWMKELANIDPEGAGRLGWEYFEV